MSDDDGDDDEDDDSDGEEVRMFGGVLFERYAKNVDGM